MNIVILDGYVLNPGDLSWDGFHEFGNITVYDRTPAELVFERARDAEVIYTNKTVLDKDIINRLTKLKFIGVLATGYNVVDTSAAKERGILVANVPAYSTMSVVQMVFSLLFDICFKVHSHSEAVHLGEWVNSKDFSFWKYPMVEVSGKTLGIIGFGRIGRAVCDAASAFGMNVAAYSRTKTDESHRKNFTWTDLDELLKISDIITLHCPLLPETKEIINEKTIVLMKPSAILINTSRGGLINESDLSLALNTTRIAGAGLDVLSSEPPAADNPLLTAKNCVITPHVAWATKEARQRLMDTAVKNLRGFVSGNPVNIVNL